MSLPMQSICVCRFHYVRNFRNLIKLSKRFIRIQAGNKFQHRYSIDLENDKRLIFEHGYMARLANGSAVFKLGGTAVLVTAVAGTTPNRSIGMTPLIVDYRQSFSAAGRIPTNVLRRERGPSEKELITSRMIDRSIRPLFPEGQPHDIQVTCKVLSVDGIHDPDVLCINAASAALLISDVPWNGPIGAVRVAMRPNMSSFIAFPTRAELAKSKLNLVVVAHMNNYIVMLEGTGDNVPWTTLKRAISFGVEKSQSLAASIVTNCCKEQKNKRLLQENAYPESLLNMVYRASSHDIEKVYARKNYDKLARDTALKNLRFKVASDLSKMHPDISETTFHEIMHLVVKKNFRDKISKDNIRCDGRGLGDIRRITSSVDVYEPLHGSAMFQRGQTQVLATVAFDSLVASARADPVSVLTGAMKEKNFMLHYQFPGFAVNEARSGDGGSRREIGHGALAESGLRPVLPDNYQFAIRVTSDVLESNGSSSMASVCAGCMALMDAGVPITEPVAGVAMGLISEKNTLQITLDSDSSNHNNGDITSDSERLSDVDLGSIRASDEYEVHYGTLATENTNCDKTNNNRVNRKPNSVDKEDGNYVILTDLMGIEDYMGDMDFKIAGTRTGFTALQTDVKLIGVPVSVILETISQATAALATVLDKMSQTISSPRSSRKESGPILENITVLPADRYKFIGVGGYNLRKLTKETGVSVTPVDESTYQVFAPNPQAMEEAKAFIDKCMEKTAKVPELDFGAVYEVKIVELREIGVMVQMHPAMVPVLLHNTQLDSTRVSHPSALGLEEGDFIKVKYFGRDPVTGNVRISRKAITRTTTHVSFFKDTKNA